VKDNILDALVQATTKPHEFKKMLIEKAQESRKESIRYRRAIGEARAVMRRDLIEWLDGKHYPGKGRKRLLDKVISEVLRSYSGELWIAQINDMAAERRASRGPSFRAKTRGPTRKVRKKKRKSQWQRQRW
jgi:hypothetical protein